MGCGVPNPNPNPNLNLFTGSPEIKMMTKISIRNRELPRFPACDQAFHFYNAPVLDIKLIREKADLVRQRLATRGGGDENRIDSVLALDERRRKALAEVEQLKATRNRLSKDIGALMAHKESAAAEGKKAETRALGESITQLDAERARVEAERDTLMLQFAQFAQ